MSTALSSGIEVRKIWPNEAGRVPPRFRPAIEQIGRGVAGGEQLAQALARTGDTFPPLFRELVALGDATGRLPEILLRLAEQYEHQQQLKRNLMAAILWPMLQLAAAVVIVGLLIWVMGVIGSMTGSEPLDILGLGLVGTRGLVIYVAVVAAIVVIGYGLYRLVISDRFASGPLQQLLLRLPVVGRAVESVLLSRFAWSLGLCLEAGMDARRALPFAFRSTGSAVFGQHLDTATAVVGRGQTIEEALAATRQFPHEFLATVGVGEESGKLAESLLHTADQLQQQARAALHTLTVVGGFAIWGMIALLIVTMIIRIFNEVYLKPIRDLL